MIFLKDLIILIIAITGPRQSGKTTIARKTFPDADYISLESLDNKEIALNDPRGFIEKYSKQVIIDEIQNVPILFPYLQEYSDKNNQNGKYILTGSQNFLLVEKITQSLAGRIFIFNLLPFSYNELSSKFDFEKSEEIMFKGFYPRLHSQQINPQFFYPQYIQTYIERDVRQIKNIFDLNLFHKFLKLCAARTGQIINLSEIGNQIGVKHNTVKSWINILEESYIVFLLRLYYKNFNKRIIKNPKLYFYDSGIVCSLLGINSIEQLDYHYLRGGIFENMVISEKLKSYFYKGIKPEFYFLRDSNGNEVDLIVENATELDFYEIKSSKTFQPTYFNKIDKIKKVFTDVKININLIYNGNEEFSFKDKNVLPWGKII
ncbi:MAG: ATP-binding protein [Candidatus Muiribacteriota bacterium]